MVDLSKYAYNPGAAEKQQALYRALMAAGGQLAAAAAPSTQPGGLSRGIAGFGQAFGSTYDQAMAANRAKQLQALQRARAITEMERAERGDKRLGVVHGREDTAYTRQQKLQAIADQQAAAEAERWRALRSDPQYAGLPRALLKHKIEQQQKTFAPKVPVPGRDVPLSPNVFQQKVAISAAGKPTWTQGTDPVSKLPIQTNTLTGEQKPGVGAKPMSGDQANAALFADRMAIANSIISTAGPEAVDPKEKVLGSVPLVGNYLVSEEYQLLDQAKRDFINATLRRESGAAIAQSEFDNANKQYFPQPGDSPAVLLQKQQNRNTAIRGIARAAGPTYASPEVQDNSPPSNRIKIDADGNIVQ